MSNRTLAWISAVAIAAVLSFAAGWSKGVNNGRAWAVREIAPEIQANADALNALSDRIIYLKSAYSTTGLASFYSYPFHGRTTASMEIFDKDKLTAASRWLPLKTWWAVTRIDTGASVRVWVNDRGPYVGNRIIDLSEAAARKLGMLDAGVVTVRIRPAL